MSEDITIVAVDDQPQNLRLLQAILSPRGYHVVPVSSGEEALARLPGSSADLVLLDIVMPAMDGY
jgi:adenylate cyclase